MKFWSTVKHYAFTFVGAMIMEPKNGGQGISLGRVCFLGVLGIMAMRWFRGMEALDTLLSVWYVLAGYVLGSKVVDTAKAKLGRVTSKFVNTEGEEFYEEGPL